MTLASMQTMLSNYAPTSEQCLNALEMLALNLRCPNATLALNKLQVDFLGRTNTHEGVAPQADEIKNFLSKLRFPKSKKASSHIEAS